MQQQLGVDEDVEKSLSDYPLIPMGEIDMEARLLAVRWVENYEPCGFDLPNKQKLASDIMNYARRQKQQIADVKCMRWVKAKERLPKDDKLYNATFNDEPCVMKVKEGVVIKLQFASGGVYSNPGTVKLRCTEWLEHYYEAKEVSQENNELHERALDVSTDQIIQTQKERNEKDEEIKRLREALEKEDWISVEDSPPTGTEVLGFHPSWIDEDFNPDGICVCHLSDEGIWTIAKWCGTCDEWHTAYSENWTSHQTGAGHKIKRKRKRQGVSESEMSTRVMISPTHWKRKPNPPIQP